VFDHVSFTYATGDEVLHDVSFRVGAARRWRSWATQARGRPPSSACSRVSTT
jgi:hypothetical protein